MADGTKAVVETSAEDEAALAVALGDIPGDTPKDTPEDTPEKAPEDMPEDSPEETPEDAAAQPEAEATGEAVDEPAPASEGPAEATSPLSTAEIAAEPSVDTAPRAKSARAKAAKATAKPAKATPEPAPGPATETTTEAPSDTDTDTDAADALPLVLRAPLRHSGDKIGGRYRLEECTTQSEAFSSWRAVDEKLRRAVGVHLLAAGHQRAEAVLAAAKAAALLGDPRFVQVLDAVQEGELVYVVREWLPEASDLAQLLADGPMEPYDAYQMARQVTDAIATAHRRGQAHLRLTPRCVLRTESGQYRINGIAVDAALRGLPAKGSEDAQDAELADARAIGALLYAALTHRWPYTEDRYDLRGLPRSLGCVPPDQVKAGVHKGLSELAARAVCEHPPHHQDPITSPEQLAKAIALMPKIRQPEPPAPPAFTPPRYSSSRPAQPATAHAHSPAEPPGAVPHPNRPYPGHPHPTRPGRRRRLRAALKWTASAVALAAIGIGSWQLVSSLHGSKDDTAPHPGSVQTHSALPVAPSSRPIQVAGVQSFNPLGDQPEHPESVGNAVDGKAETVWPTSSYNDPFGAWKEGTGLLLDLGSVRQVRSVHVQLAGSSTVELRAAPGATSAPAVSKAGLDSLGTAAAKGTGTDVDLTPGHALSTRYLLIWLTDIPKDVEGRYQGRVAEIKVMG